MDMTVGDLAVMVGVVFVVIGGVAIALFTFFTALGAAGGAIAHGWELGQNLYDRVFRKGKV